MSDNVYGTRFIFCGSEIEYAVTASGVSDPPGPVWTAAAAIATYLGFPPPETVGLYSGEWIPSKTSDRLLLAPDNGAVVAGLSDGLPSAFLANGGRMYLDHTHPEFSTPEVRSPLDAVHYEWAGQRIMVDAVALAAEALRARFGDGLALRLFKVNSDGKGHSWGAHENYLVSRSLPLRHAAWLLLSHLVSRIVFTGAGKVGSEAGRPHVQFQAAQRPDFFTQVTSIQTTYERGVVNLRDEPLADPGAFRRLHVIAGDSNMSPYATWLKIGSTQLLLRLLSIQALSVEDLLMLADPVDDFWRLSHDVNHRLTLTSGLRISAFELQQSLVDACRATEVDLSDAETELLDAWESVLADVELDPYAAADRVDWAMKYRLLEASGFDPASAQAKALDTFYHELGPGSMHERLVASGLFALPPGFSPAAVSAAVTSPPDGRPAARAAAIRSGREWASFDWDAGVTTSGETVSFPGLT